ncbi:methionine ABC transporter permease MetI [Photorhabdus laumondii subsp. laumondii]|uniref:D-methionine transport system permease protein MetI n=2 Tax=Photorhabdus laumondii subsp. laumondii TaxID=141679 RepID=Q7N8M3_PHOLL|nr:MULTISPECIES: methionine ABC transporter permease MetI [Photorhabdus]AWK40643.1 DL-methionine transporter permease subunit [Photorhabdus laumondii subsp. laumondii]AXG41459.1 D-methionine ABC transporter permease MetI [Photorhabdus laumondii subsp. laumondii]AXG45983.1 D-methionine ABC transporter permease MetI [Photorhabdus laumondii subsp. laumondii]KTL61844.1 DL-methionine transporter permease subunit [Photorhabdus laumondii subsp. laumondii]MCC8383887.1 methionine ABC transporter permea
MSEGMMLLLAKGVWETLVMTFVSGFFGFIIGLPIGVLLYVTRPNQIMENSKLYRFLSAVVNIFRSIPFIILLVWMIPFTRLIVGTSIGLQAAIVPLTIGAAPFIARMVENALLEIPSGLIEAARAMGASPFQIIKKILLPEALPGLLNAATITLITLVGYSAMGGAVGAGGLGQIGYQYGYIGYNATVMNTVLVLLVILVYLIQLSGDHLVKATTRK